MTATLIILSMLVGFFFGGTTLFGVAWWLELCKTNPTPKTPWGKNKQLRERQRNGILLRLEEAEDHDIAWHEAVADIRNILK